MKNTRKEKNLRFKIENRQRKVKIDTGILRYILEQNPGFFSAPPEEIGVILVSDRIIKNLNRRFLKKNCSTDILSFNISRSYGEIVISSETALENSRIYGLSVEKEILYLILHGYLHLKGWKDYAAEEKTAMLKLQDEIFNKITGETLPDGKKHQ